MTSRAEAFAPDRNILCLRQWGFEEAIHSATDCEVRADPHP